MRCRQVLVIRYERSYLPTRDLGREFQNSKTSMKAQRTLDPSRTPSPSRRNITRTALGKAERGDPCVSLGIYAVVLFMLGLTPSLPTRAQANSGFRSNKSVCRGASASPARPRGLAFTLAKNAGRPTGRSTISPDARGWSCAGLIATARGNVDRRLRAESN
jgi:hypothetical protein